MKIKALSLLAAATLGWGVGCHAESLGCLIEPDRVADVGTQVVGVLEQMKVERGDTVSAGQILARLTAQVERASVNVAQTVVHPHACAVACWPDASGPTSASIWASPAAFDSPLAGPLRAIPAVAVQSTAVTAVKRFQALIFEQTPKRRVSHNQPIVNRRLRLTRCEVEIEDRGEGEQDGR